MHKVSVSYSNSSIFFFNFTYFNVSKFYFSIISGTSVRYDSYLGVVQAGAVEIRGMKTSLAPRRQQTQADPTTEKYVYVPLNNNKVSS